MQSLQFSFVLCFSLISSSLALMGLKIENYFFCNFSFASLGIIFVRTCNSRNLFMNELMKLGEVRRRKNRCNVYPWYEMNILITLVSKFLWFCGKPWNYQTLLILMNLWIILMKWKLSIDQKLKNKNSEKATIKFEEMRIEHTTFSLPRNLPPLSNRPLSYCV